MMATSAEDQTIAWATRAAGPDDLDAFLGLARSYTAEAGRPFDENEARWLFAGVARSDPAIYLLAADAQLVGFTLVRHISRPLTGVQCIQEELVYVRKDMRSAEAEMLLHTKTIAVFEAAEAFEQLNLLVPSSNHCTEVIDQLAALGLRSSGLRMTGRRAAKKTDSAESYTRH